MEATQLLRPFKVDILKQLPAEQQVFFKWFLALTEVNRPSFHLDEARQIVMKWGDALGVPHKEDKAGNILFTIPATKGKEHIKPIALQGHLDIVAVGQLENGKVPLKLENGKLFSGVSTIGADDGVAIAAMLAVMEEKDKFEHGVIECLVTLDEEVGLVGAGKLEGPPFLQSRTLLNLDSEEWGVFITSCAGSVSIWYDCAVNRAEFSGRTLSVTVSGLLGGHTGITIQEGRSNALKWIARLLMEAKISGSDFRIVSINGGEKHNAIPDNATVVIVTSDSGIEDKLKKTHQELLHESKAIETKVPKLAISEASVQKPMSKESTDKVLNLLLTIYHGVWQMHPEISGLVNTSQSLSVCKTENDLVRYQVYARTNEATQMHLIEEVNRSLASLAGVECKIPPEEIMGPWPAALEAKIIDTAKQVYKRCFGTEAKIEGIHAGLECGCIQNRGYSDLEAISYGPDVVGAHSVDENLSVDSAVKFYTLTLEILKDWAK